MCHKDGIFDTFVMPESIGRMMRVSQNVSILADDEMLELIPYADRLD